MRRNITNGVIIVIGLTNIHCGNDSGGGGDPLDVVITNPTDTLHTRGEVTVQVAVNGGTADRLDLLRDGVVLASLDPPYQYAWDTIAEPEGDHALIARAFRGSDSFDSPTRVVVVDRTAPRVVDRMPAPGDDQVWVHDVLRATFSEALDPASIEGSVRLENDVGALPADPALSVDGLSLTVIPYDPPVAPDSLTIDLAPTITDLAGNPLEAPAEPWTFVLPEWLHLGAPLDEIAGDQSDSYNSLLRVDATGMPVVAWNESLPGTTIPTVQVARWQGDAWVSFTQMDPASELAMTLTADGTPLLARSRDAASDDFVRVERWDGADWAPIGSDLGVQPSEPANSPSVAVDATGHAIVAWHEYSDGTSSDNVYVRRWTGVDWAPLGTLVSANALAGTHARYPDVVLGPGDRVLVAWTEIISGGEFELFVAEWNGSSWPLLGAALDMLPGTSAAEPTLAFDGTAPVLAWREGDFIFVRRWNGTDWEPVGNALGDGDAGQLPRSPTLAVDPVGTVLVAWSEQSPTSSRVSVARFGGSGWEPVGSGVLSSDGSTSFDTPSLVVTGEGDLFLSVEDRAATSQVHALRLNR